MIDVNKITSTLAKLSDLQLQTYAKMNPDPYTIALAVAESNRRKELRAAGQGAQGMQEMPKVVDQAVAEMAPQQLPEDMGIARIPAGDMNFAGGGIIAFADGGGVERYNGTAGSLTGEVQRILQKSPYDRTPQDNALLEQAGYSLQRRTLSPDSGVAGVNTYLEGIGPNIRNYFTAGTSQLSDEELAQQPSVGGAQNERILRGLGINPSVPKAASAAPTQAASAAPTASNAAMIAKASTDPSANRMLLNSAEQAARKDPAVYSAPSKAEETGRAAPTADTGRKAPGAGLADAAAATRTESGPSSIDALQQKYFGEIDQEVGGLRNARAGLVAGIKDLTEQNLAATKADIEKRGDVYKGREARLAEQEKGLAGMSDKYMGLALLQAGAAMMSTPGGLGVALGKGVQVGSERYAAGLDKINAAKEKFAEARDRLDDLRISRDDMNAKEIRAAEKEVRESKLKGQELLYNGLVSDLGIKQKNVTAIFGAAANALQSDKEIASRERTSKEQIAAANRTPAEIQMVERVMKEKNIPFTEALALLSSSKREGVSEEKLRGEWLDTAKRMQIAQDYPNVKTFEDYKTVMGMGGGGGGFKVVGVR